jgi:succinate dehydrogenase / fumarate reductase membrane anchor subunit
MIRSVGGGSARGGLGEWLVQRLSAVYLAGFALWLGVCLARTPVFDYTAWKAWMSGGAVRVAFALCLLSLLLHAWVGMRSVFLDYLKPLWLRFLAQSVTAATLIACAFWGAHILMIEVLAR